ncbi:amino acid ABC transporter substrate-binding protein [Ruminococcus champanellensis]|uniref:Amino acid ABC transporter substrate-binding protein, PAAT family (TC 3.A.1.3.-) n=1 Tax=Ruminococcus champanellensis (strain DSM 18848 / JCM 17042 / KCTC 15320 / 18P13) TaxID=213810 RepID=D4LEP0_RUMC1|nr:amino acid ABC transporter substrate-binding protein [Ruminococcus champanellensis]CBL18085.1 amino acid ABC transporter substrate-binding protein, PAAT family (TC 3.A.1.3.-) [Ruminococcus champanellensis 18P13 = JCM 17042]
MKLKSIFAILTAGVLACTGLTACGDDKAASNQKATFTVGFDQDFPPFGYVDENGEFTGFDLELAKEAAKRMDMEIKLQPIDWDSKELELSSGSISCIWNGFTMNGRENDYTWTESYMDNSQVFVVKSDSGIKTQADLAGKIVTAQTDSAALNALNGDDFKDLKASFKELLTCAQYNTAFMDLEAGAVDAVAMDIGVAKYQIEGKESKFIILDEPIVKEQYAVGFYKGNTEMRDKVQKALDEMAADGTFKKISEKWFGYDVCTLAAAKNANTSASDSN